MSNIGGGSRKATIERMRRYLDSLPQDYSVKEEIKSFRFWKAVRSELLATLLLVVVGCGAASYDSATESTSIPVIHHPVIHYHVGHPPLHQVGDETVVATTTVPTSVKSNITSGATTSNIPIDVTKNVRSELREVKVSLVFGLVIATLVQCVGNISGGHLNPAVSIAMLVSGHISPLRSVIYILAQCLGAVIGAAILYGLTPSELRRNEGGLGVTFVHPSISTTQAFGVEFMTTLLVTLTVFAVLDPNRMDPGCKALSIGFSYTAGHLFAVSIYSFFFFT